jgi:hypothetical protein
MYAYSVMYSNELNPVEIRFFSHGKMLLTIDCVLLMPLLLTIDCVFTTSSLVKFPSVHYLLYREIIK